MADADSTSANAGTPGKEPPPSTREKQPQSSAYGDMATIEVGRDGNKRTFYVQKGLLSFYSGYFRAALNGSWLESEDGTIKLETETPNVFERFVLWLYTSKITDDTIELSFYMIVRLWVFADSRNIPLLMNEMVDCLKQRMFDMWAIPILEVGFIYTNTAPDSALRRVIIDAFSTVGGPSLLDDPGNWPQEALMDLAKRFLAAPGPPKLTKKQYEQGEVCPTYHVHEEGIHCAKQGVKRLNDGTEKE